ncbi:universal stress protein A-like protein [Cryptomeria japonica]|uniref:universal stress protein A-like protein n=1 Tax=Cryptomeria japonica TaxID=3369 RepID=UPI0027D9FB95|nr:universal stress protein A-like protein [Cryptomeria japonica]
MALDCIVMEKIEQVSEDKVMNIVVAVDESQESMRACEWACNHLLASHTNSQQSYKFTLLHVQPPVSVTSGPAYILSSEVFYLLECEDLRTTHKIFKQALDICNRYNVRAETHVVIGEPKVKVCEAVQKLGAHFLVMGSHGHGPFIRAIKGSVSDHCSRNAMCPVVVVNKKVF